MDTLQFEMEAVPVRTLALYELAETYIEKRLRPVGRADRDNIKLAFRLLAERFPAIDTSQFDGEHLEEFQRFLITKDYARTFINKLTGFVKSVYYWCARKKLVSPSIAAELRLVPALQYSEAVKENPDREDAKPEDIEDTVEAANRDGHVQFADMVSDTCTHRSTSVRSVRYESQRHQKRNRRVRQRSVDFPAVSSQNEVERTKTLCLLGDEEQAILNKYLPNTDEQTPHVFRNLQLYRNKAMTPGTYSRILAKIIKKYGLKKFTPYQIRHTNATWVSKTLDRDHARAQMGHTSETMTRKYDHSTDEKQKAVLEVRKTAGCVLSRNVIDRHMVGSQSPPPPPKAMPSRRWIGLTIVCLAIMFGFGSCRFIGQEAVLAEPAPHSPNAQNVGKHGGISELDTGRDSRCIPKNTGFSVREQGFDSPRG